MKRFGYRESLLATSAALTTGALAAEDLGPHPWQVEAGAFFPQEEIEDLIGDATFYAAVLKDVHRGPGGAVTSIGGSWLQESERGNEIQVVGLFLRQTWYGRRHSGDYGGVFAGFDVGIFNSRIETAVGGGGNGGGNNGGGGSPFQIGSGETEDQLGVGAGLFVGYTFGERLSIRGGYNVYPSVAGTSVSGFVATVGFRF